MDHRELELKLASMGLIVEKLEHWAATQPEKTFIYYGEEDVSYSYAEFNRLANCVAHNLQSMGVAKGDQVSLFLKNPWITVLSMFALWKIGAIFCPVNFLYKGRLLSYQINDTAPTLLITENGREPLLNKIAGDISCHQAVVYRPRRHMHDYDPETAELRLKPPFEEKSFSNLLKGHGSNPGVELNYWDTANIIYTSGTTGPPKGVVQSYRWLQNYCYYGVSMLHFDDVIYCDLPLYHVGGAFSLVGRAAWRGCTVSLWDRFSASKFWQRIKVSGASVGLLLDVMMPWLLKADPSPDDRHNTLRRVHMQPLPEYHHTFAQRFGIDFVNVGYGATEVGYVCAAIIDESVNGGGTPPEFAKGYTKQEVYDIAQNLGMLVIPGDQPIAKGFMGRACIQHQVSILDEHDKELEAGSHGQLAVRPRLPYLLLNEYFKKPEASLAANRNFWFHTGDVGYKGPDGIFYFVDRMGGFIRVKGENIGSFQIEDIINSHPKVSVSAVFSVPAVEGLEDDIVVYIVPDEGQELSEEDMRSWIQREMPVYMQPKHLRFISELPQTPTYKVEKYKLKEMFLKEIK
jgi:crotonobetaine/carnitine-CoA ligase